MSHADKLREMVNNFTTLTKNLTASMEKIDALITDLTEQWKAIDYAEDQIESDLETYVETNKADYFYSYGNYGISGTGNLKEWMGFDEETVTNLTYVSTNEFTVDGDKTSTFTAGTSAVVVNGTTFSSSTTISASIYNDPLYPAKTLVTLDSGICQSNLNKVYLESYANWGPLWDSDATVQGYMDDWVFIDDFLTKNVGTDGTYGITDRLDNLYTAKSIVQKDYNKYDGMIPIIDVYAT